MKKILSVMLAIMMLFGAMSISVSAAPATTDDMIFGKTVIFTGNESITLDASRHTIIELNFGNGKSLEGLMVYDTTNTAFTRTLDVTGRYLMLPGCGYEMKAGQWIRLPAVQAPEGLTCQGWEVRGTSTVVGHGIDWQIPQGSNGKVIELVARYTTAEPEEDTMAMVLGVLMKVFGTIIGILFLDGNSTAGVELMEKMLGGLLG